MAHRLGEKLAINLFRSEGKDGPDSSPLACGAGLLVCLDENCGCPILRWVVVSVVATFAAAVTLELESSSSDTTMYPFVRFLGDSPLATPVNGRV